jgi:nucleotide-binding universal stress UspA family protein
MVKRVLIPTDGSDYGHTALKYGIYIARLLEAHLTGLHVIDIRLIQGPVLTDISGSVGLPPYQEFIPVLENGLEERADAIIETFRRRCEEAGLVAEVKKVVGVIEEAIIEEGKDADWIILARQGEHVHIGKGGLLGSTAELVVRKAGKPVMVTPAVFKEIESMALAYDGSPPAHNALKLAVELSGLARWPLTIVIIANDQDLAAKLTEKLDGFLEETEIDHTTVVLQGREDAEILRFIREGAVELMVMGAYGHNRLRELFLGSTTSSVIRKSNIPILLTR